DDRADPAVWIFASSVSIWQFSHNSVPHTRQRVRLRGHRRKPQRSHFPNRFESPGIHRSFLRIERFRWNPPESLSLGSRRRNPRTLEFGRLVLELIRWNVASGSANAARPCRRRGDVGRLTTRLRALPTESMPSAPAGTTRD